MHLRKLLVSLTAVAAVSLSAYSANRTWKVGKAGEVDFDEIHKVLTNTTVVVQNGDRIEVGPGVYQPIVIPDGISCLEIVATAWEGNDNKNLSVHDRTVIDGGGNERCFVAPERWFSSEVGSADNVVLRGFTLRNGYSDQAGGGAYGGLVDCCVITNCDSIYGGGAAYSIVRNSRIVSCRAKEDGGGIMMSRATGCWIENCDAGRKGGGAYVYVADNDPSVKDKVFPNVLSSVVINNSTNGNYIAQANIYPSMQMGHVIVRTNETGTVFLQDTGYDIRSIKYNSRANSWYSENESRFDPAIYFGDRDINGRPRFTGYAVDIGPEEFPDNSVSMRQSFVTMGKDAGEFTVDVGAPGMTSTMSDWEWKIVADEPCDWISGLPCSGKGTITNSLVFKVSANTNGVSRTATLKIVNNDDNLLSPRKLAVTQLATGAIHTNGYAVCFGPGIYDDDHDSPKGGPWCSEQEGMANDARVFGQKLVINGLCDLSHVLCFTGKNATHDKFVDGMNRVAQVVKAGEIVYIYVSTHGGSASNPYEYMFTCYEDDGYIHDSEICDLIRKITAKGAKAVMVIDTCRSSGAFRNAVPVETRLRNSYYDSDMYAEGGDVAFITAADYFEDSQGGGRYEDGMEAGKFSAAFVREWRKLAAQTTDAKCGSFLDVLRAVLRNKDYYDDAIRPATRDIQWFNEALLSMIAVSGPARIPSVKVGDECNFELTADLGVAIDADYLAGDKVEVRIETLPKGLKLVKEPIYGLQGSKKVMIDCKYWVRGTPGEEMTYLRTPMFARVTVKRGKDKTETLQRVKLDVMDSAAMLISVGDKCLGKGVFTMASNTVSIAGLPAGLQFSAAESYVVLDGGVIVTNEPYSIYGIPTKAGRFTAKITCLVDDGKGGKKKAVSNETWVVSARNPGLDADDIRWGDGNTKYYEGDAQATLLQGSLLSIPVNLSGLETTGKNAARVTFTGLPSGLSYDAKTGTITGTAKSVGSKVVTVKVVQGGETVVSRFSINVVANPFSGTYYTFFSDFWDYYKMATAVITPAAGGSAKLVFEEYVPSRNKTVKYTVSTAKGFKVDTAYDPVNPEACKVSYEFNLKADARNNPDFAQNPRTLRLELAPVEYGGQNIGLGKVKLDNLGFTASADKVMTPAEYTALVEGGFLDAVAPVFCENYDGFGHITSILDPKKLQYAVKGKLVDGTTVSALSPLTWNLPDDFCTGDPARSAPFFLIEKKGAKRAYVASVQSNDGSDVFNSNGPIWAGRNSQSWDVGGVPTTAARHIRNYKGAAGFYFDPDDWSDAFGGEPPKFSVVVNGVDPDKAKIEIYAPDAPLGAKPLKTISPYKLTASSGYVFKGSFKWDLAKGGDGATYSFEFVPIENSSGALVYCFMGNCAIKPARGATVNCISGIRVDSRY